MESCGKVLIISLVFMQIFFNTQVVTKSIYVLDQQKYMSPVATSNNHRNVKIKKTHFLKALKVNLITFVFPVNITALQTKFYMTKPLRSIETFSTHPELKLAEFKDPLVSAQYTSYAPPPSGLVSYKNVQLPFTENVKLPLLWPISTTLQDFTKHPGFETIYPPEVELEMQHPKSIAQVKNNASFNFFGSEIIEAANILTSRLLQDSDKHKQKLLHEAEASNVNTTNIFLIKSQKKTNANIKPLTFDGLLPLSNHQFEKAYTINQFIFVIKPENINLLSKLNCDKC